MRRAALVSENSMRAYADAMNESSPPQNYQPIYAHELSTPDARRSRPVSNAEFQSLAHQGHQLHSQLSSSKQDTSGIDNNWDATVKHAYEATRQPWGGATYHPGTGQPLQGNENLYAITAKDRGHDTVEIHPNATYPEFHKAMTSARQQFAPELSRQGHHLGVFHDADVNAVQFDPAYVTPNHNDVETLGAYTRNVGGAYHFQSGDGYWPPHVDPRMG